MADQFVGEIRIFPFNFAPRGWAFCDGQLLAISQNAALFSLLGTFYGGDGRSNFALPNLQGQAAMDAGSGLGLTTRVIGETVGESTLTLLTSEILGHAHVLNADTDTATSTSPSGNLPAVPLAPPRTPPAKLYGIGFANTPMLAGNLLPTGGGQPHNNMQPYLTLNLCVAMVGIFPARG